MARRRHPRPVTLLLLAGLLASTAACGARWTDDQRAAVAARSQGTSAGTVDPAGTAAAGGGTSDGTASAAESTGSAASTGGAQPGTGQGAGAGASSERPCAAASDAKGVSDDEIAVAAISSLSGPVAGLGASAAAATRAHVAYRNDSGGVCGRRVVLREADDGTDVGRYRALVGRLEPEVFGIAGGFALGDVGGADVVQQTGIPVVNNPGGDAMSVVPNAFDINPPFDSLDVVIGKYRFLHEQGARQVAMAYLAVDQSRAEAQVQRRLMEAAGLRIVSVQELPISTLSFDSTARSVANSGADYLFFIGDANSNVSMARSMADTRYRLRFAEYYVFSYGTDFIAAAGTASEGAMTWLRTLPNEDADRNEEMARFLDWMDRIASDDVRDVFAADAWAATKAFFDGLEALPGPITREAFVAQMASVGTYDAGGMLGPIRLGAERTNGCFVGLRVEQGQWRRLAPAEGFLCI